MFDWLKYAIVQFNKASLPCPPQKTKTAGVVQSMIDEFKKAGYQGGHWSSLYTLPIHPFADLLTLDPARVHMGTRTKSFLETSYYMPLAMPDKTGDKIWWRGGGWLLEKRSGLTETSYIAIRTGEDDLIYAKSSAVEIEILRNARWHEKTNDEPVRLTSKLESLGVVKLDEWLKDSEMTPIYPGNPNNKNTPHIVARLDAH